ncbi:hypothetical protein BCU80_06180 [Vibrio breoganii]|nr:hypothetical protein BCU80_06180 [Vibrio breoganii]
MVFGGTGYIGNKLTEYFIAKGYVVANVSRGKSQVFGVINYDINGSIDYIIDEFSPTSIIYLSAVFNDKHIESMIWVNIQTPTKILSYISGGGRDIDFIYVGSYWQLGDASVPGTPIDLYSATKCAAYSIIDYYSAYSNVRCKRILLYGTYGPSDGRGKVLDYLIDSAIAGTTVELTEGYQKLNLVFIDDICSSIDKVLLCNEHLDFSIYSDKEYSLREIVAYIKQYVRFDVVFGAKPYRKNELMDPIYTEACHSIIIKDSLLKYIRKRLG